MPVFFCDFLNCHKCTNRIPVHSVLFA